MKILLYDVETFPHVGLTWDTWETNVLKIIRRKMICSISYQWYPDKKVTTIALPDFPGYDPKIHSNKLLLKAFAKVRAVADIEIGHNVIDFDDKEVNRDFFLNGILPGPPSRKIDTLRVCRSRFNLPSNKLEEVCLSLGIGEKWPHPGLKMWLGCMEGNAKSWYQMKKYNAHDVDPLLRGLYEHLRPWIRNHPNITIGAADGCPTCGHKHLKPGLFMYTQTQKYQLMQCKLCTTTCRAVVVKGSVVFRP